MQALTNNYQAAFLVIAASGKFVSKTPRPRENLVAPALFFSYKNE
jgi:hypothetical protein